MCLLFVYLINKYLLASSVGSHVRKIHLCSFGLYVPGMSDFLKKEEDPISFFSSFLVRCSLFLVLPLQFLH